VDSLAFLVVRAFFFAFALAFLLVVARLVPAFLGVSRI